MPSSGTSRGSELLVRLDRAGPGPLRARLEDALRDAIRSGALAARAPLPSTRVLAADLGVSRRLVVEAYEQLVAEGYLVASPRSGTRVAAVERRRSPRAAGAAARAEAETAPAPDLDLGPGTPDLAAFPRQAWRRSLVHVLRTAPRSALGYPDPRGSPALRRSLAAYLGRVRGVVADPEHVVVCAGFTQALALLTRVLGETGAGRPRIAVEDPGLQTQRDVIAGAGGVWLPVPVDGAGIDVERLRASRAGAAVVTPAHQFPTGVSLAPERRAALLEWAAGGRLVVEDDYDAEFRFDRSPVGALQGLLPERVVYVGSASKTLAPGLRLGWAVLPPDLAERVAGARRLDDRGGPVLEQLALADLVERGAYDRHLRLMRRSYRRRRDALAAGLSAAVPGLAVTGVAAGLHLVVGLPAGADADAVVAEAARRGLVITAISRYRARPAARPAELVLGYGGVPEAAVPAVVERLAACVAAAAIA
jgi:GntR family transcriptional regulator/MocR family aminotransferase